MAIVTTNPLVNGLSGMLGRSLVFKNIRGRTIVGSRPRPPKTQSEQQRQNRSKFKQASAWAKIVLLDSQKKAYYQQKAKKLKLPNAYTAAIADYMRKPQLKEIGRRDHMMTYIVRKKDFELKSGEVQLLHAEGSASEAALIVPNQQGELIFSLNEDASHNGWLINVVDKAGIRIVLTIPSFRKNDF
jgi:hypothetical protein